MLDDLRRRLRVDTDRMYLAGQGGGAATACATAFALPELVGGAVAVSGGGPPRPEPWLRDRARERLSVAFVTGEKDPRRGEVERWRHPPVRDGGIRAQVWVSRALPAPAELEAAYLWLEAGVPQRWRLASAYPASRLAEFSTPTAGEWSLTLLREAAARLRRPDTRDSGLMQLHGVTTRWPSSAAAAQAEKVLKAHKWQEVYQAAQQRAAYHQARATTAYLAGPLDEAEARRKKELLRAALADWSRVLEHGKDTDMGKEARGKVDGLKRLLGEGD